MPDFFSIISILSGDMTQWLLTTYFQAAGELYGGFTQRHVIASSYSVDPYTAAFYYNTGSPVDPTIMIYGGWDGFNRVLYSLQSSLKE